MSTMQGHGSVDEPRQFSKFLSKLVEDEPEFSLENAESAVLPRGAGWRARIDTAKIGDALAAMEETGILDDEDTAEN